MLIAIRRAFYIFIKSSHLSILNNPNKLCYFRAIVIRCALFLNATLMSLTARVGEGMAVGGVDVNALLPITVIIGDDVVGGGGGGDVLTDMYP